MADMYRLEQSEQLARQQVQGRDRVGSPDDLYDELRDTDDESASRLTEDDWDALHPSNFTGTPRQVNAAMSRLYGQLVAQRAQEAAAAPVARQANRMRQQAERVRNAQQIPAAGAGVGNPANVPWDQLVETYNEQMASGRLDPHVNRAFLAGMQQRGLLR